MESTEVSAGSQSDRSRWTHVAYQGLEQHRAQTPPATASVMIDTGLLRDLPIDLIRIRQSLNHLWRKVFGRANEGFASVGG